MPTAQLIVAGVLLLLIPLARHLPALAGLGTVSAALVALVAFERLATAPNMGDVGDNSESPERSEAEPA